MCWRNMLDISLEFFFFSYESYILLEVCFFLGKFIAFFFIQYNFSETATVSVHGSGSENVVRPVMVIIKFILHRKLKEKLEIHYYFWSNFFLWVLLVFSKGSLINPVILLDSCNLIHDINNFEGAIKLFIFYFREIIHNWFFQIKELSEQSNTYNNMKSVMLLPKGLAANTLLMVLLWIFWPEFHNLV